jgi:signal transduction histidine kinase
MRIRERLTLLFTALMAGLMLLFAIAIYWAYADNREEEFFRRLRLQAETKAGLLFDAGVAPEVLQLIYQNSRNTLYQEEVAIYDSSFTLLYHDAVEIDFVKETADMLSDIQAKGEIYFFQEGWQIVGFTYTHAGHTYLLTAAAYDDYGLVKMKNLVYILSIAWLISVIVIFFAGRLFSRKALQPVSAMVDRVEEITATKLDRRLNEGNGTDEIAELAITFNLMLDRLENSFNAQRSFVYNISHEIRTPLAAIIAELGLAKSQQRSLAEYEKAIDHALSDAQKLSRLSTGLLDLAKASYYQTEVKFKEVRIDELLLDARQQVVRANPAYKVNITFTQEPDEDDTNAEVQGNEYLLKTAFANLMENGCKFSENKQTEVSISFRKPYITITFSDKGVGIAQDELARIFEPFYRGSNKSNAEGHGIGLSLTQKIIKLHSGEINVSSAKGAGTAFTVQLPQS